MPMWEFTLAKPARVGVNDCQGPDERGAWRGGVMPSRGSEKQPAARRGLGENEAFDLAQNQSLLQLQVAPLVVFKTTKGHLRGNCYASPAPPLFSWEEGCSSCRPPKPRRAGRDT